MIEPHFFEKLRRKTLPSILFKKNNNTSIRGTFTKNNSIFLYMLSQEGTPRLYESENAKDFKQSENALPDPFTRLLQLDTIDQGHFAIVHNKSKGLGITISKNMKKWTPVSWIASKDLHSTFSNGVIIPDYQLDGEYIMFLGGPSLQLAASKDGVHWHIHPKRKLKLAASAKEEIEVDLAKKLPGGILLCYRTISTHGSQTQNKVHLALFDLHDPSRVLWHSMSPLWTQTPQLGNVEFAGAVMFRSKIYSYWNSQKMGPVHIVYSLEEVPFQLPMDHAISLERASSNPIVYPRIENYWESFATYNPAAFQAAGKVHLLYRAQGADLISSIGYASSSDGVTIDERLDFPVYTPREVFESFKLSSPTQVNLNFVSGGGIAGCEDPRTTLIGNRLYMTYVAFDGATPPRSALTSIDLDDFLAKRWNWAKPVLVSEPGIVNKSAVIFPEKIKNKYVIMHRIFPHIQIDYVDHLNFDGTWWLQEKDRIPIRDNMWDSRKIGAGAPIENLCGLVVDLLWRR